MKKIQNTFKTFSQQPHDIVIEEILNIFTKNCEFPLLSYDYDLVTQFIVDMDNEDMTFQILAFLFDFDDLINRPFNVDDEFMIIKQMYAFSFYYYENPQDDLSEAIELLNCGIKIIENTLKKVETLSNSPQVDFIKRISTACSSLLSSLSSSYKLINIMNKPPSFIDLTELSLSFLNLPNVIASEESKQLLQSFLAAVTLSFPDNEEYNERNSNIFMHIIHILTLTASLDTGIDFEPIVSHLLRVLQNKSNFSLENRIIFFESISNIVSYHENIAPMLLSSEVIKNLVPFFNEIVDLDKTDYPEFLPPENFDINNEKIVQPDTEITLPTFGTSIEESILPEKMPVLPLENFALTKEETIVLQSFAKIAFTAKFQPVATSYTKLIIELLGTMRSNKMLPFIACCMRKFIFNDLDATLLLTTASNVFDVFTQKVLEKRQIITINFISSLYVEILNQNPKEIHFLDPLFKLILTSLEQCNYYPQLTSAVCECISQAPNICVSIMETITFDELFANSMSYLRKLHCSNSNDLISQCRKQLLIIIEEMFSHDLTLTYFISSPIFLSQFFQSIYEKPLRPWFMHQLLKITSKISFSTETVPIFLHFIAENLDDYPELMDLLFNAVSLNTISLATSFRVYSFYTSVMEHIKRTKDKTQAFKLLDILSILAKANVELYFVRLYDTFAPFYENGDDVSLSDYLWKIIFGIDSKAQAQYIAEVKYGSPLLLLFLLLKGQSLLTFIKRVNDCAELSTSSALEVARSGLTSYLIQCIDTYRDKESIDELYENVAELFTFLAGYTISVKDMSSLFRCLAPLPDGKRPKISVDFIKTFLFFFQNTIDIPESIIHITENGKIEPLVFENSLNLTRFTFLFDIEFLDASNQTKDLLVVCIDHENFIKFSFFQSQIYFVLMYDNKILNGNFGYQFALKMWTKVSICYTKSELVLSVNGREQEKIQVPKFSLKGDVTTSYAFNGLPCHVGVFMFLDIDISQETLKYFQQTERTPSTFQKEELGNSNLNDGRLTSHQLFFYDPSFSSRNELINICINHPMPTKTKVEGQLFKNCIKVKTALKSTGGATAFLPLFNQFGEEDLPFLLQSLTVLLHDMQGSFDDGFLILAYLLERADRRYFNLFAIEQLKRMYNELNEELRISMLKNIFFNPSLWNDLEEEYLMKFVDFTFEVFKRDPKWFASIFSFTWIIFYIRVCFWVFYSDAGICIFTTNTKTEETKAITRRVRQKYWTLALAVADAELTEKDVNNLIDMCLDPSDPTLGGEAIQILIYLIKSDKSIVLDTMKQRNLFAQFFELFKTPYNYLHQQVISLLCAIMTLDNDSIYVLLSPCNIYKWVDSITVSINLQRTITVTNWIFDLYFTGKEFLAPICFALLAELKEDDATPLILKYSQYIVEHSNELKNDWIIPPLLYILSKGLVENAIICLRGLVMAFENNKQVFYDLPQIIESISARTGGVNDFSDITRQYLMIMLEKFEQDQKVYQMINDFIFILPDTDKYYIPHFLDEIHNTNDDETKESKKRKPKKLHHRRQSLKHSKGKSQTFTYQNLYASLAEEPPTLSYCYGMRVEAKREVFYEEEDFHDYEGDMDESSSEGFLMDETQSEQSESISSHDHVIFSTPSSENLLRSSPRSQKDDDSPPSKKVHRGSVSTEETVLIWVDEELALRLIAILIKYGNNGKNWQILSFIMCNGLRSPNGQRFELLFDTVLSQLSSSSSHFSKADTQILICLFSGIYHYDFNTYIIQVKPYQDQLCNQFGIKELTILPYVLEEKFSQIEQNISVNKQKYNKKIAFYEDNNEPMKLPENAELYEQLVTTALSFKNKKHDGEKLYKSKIRALSLINGPWWRPHEMHWMLGRTINSLTRARLKENYHYTRHEEASRLRDTHKVIVPKKIIERRRPSYIFINSDSIIDRFEANLVTIKKSYKGDVILTPTKLYFDSKKPVKHVEIELSSIKYILQRQINLTQTAFEIFTSNMSYFIDVKDYEQRATILNKLKRLLPSKFVHVKDKDIQTLLQKKTQQWIEGSLTNFSYLMLINILSGRSFNDLNQYPVFPWVLSDYTSDKIDLNDPNVYRDLSKPIGAMSPERLNHLKERMDGDANYLYSSLYSNSATVIGYLIRVEPFTSLHIELQSGKFDLTDRLFLSIPKAWDSVMTATMDFRELIPEMFYLPELLENRNGFDLGYEGGDVELPAWANSPEEFIHIHRLALESDYVTEHLPEWIDLIFGINSRGPNAVLKDNVYCPYFYPESLQTDNASVAQQYAQSFGEACQQVFKEPHPKYRGKVRIPRGKIIFSLHYVSHTDSPLIAIHGDCNLTKAMVSPKSNQVIGAIYKQNFAFAEDWDSSFIINNRAICRPHTQTVTSIHVDQNYVATGSLDGTVCCTDINTLESVVVGRHSSPYGIPIVTAVACSVGFNMVVSCSPGFIIISSLSGVIATSRKIEGVPRSVTITKTGLCVVNTIMDAQISTHLNELLSQEVHSSKSKLYVLDCNCNLIAEKDVPSMTSICAFGNSPKLCCLTKYGKVSVFSLPFLQKMWDDMSPRVTFNLCAPDGENCTVASNDGNIFTLSLVDHP